MRFLLLIALVLAVSNCATPVSQSKILERSRAEVAMRESWADSAHIRIEEAPSRKRLNWRVTAGAIDYSGYPNYRKTSFLPGSQRELRFSRSGCLLSYETPNSRCDGDVYVQQVAPDRGSK